MQHILRGQYDWGLVALSIAIAICASYTALDLAGRTAHAKGRGKTLWHCGGAMAMGLGIWAMHYIGMLAYQLPVAVSYSVPIVCISLLAAVASSAVALLVVSRKTLGSFNLVAGSLAMATGIAGMHYSGMAAMQLPAHPTYNPAMVTLSVAIAIAVSFMALFLAFHLRHEEKLTSWGRPISSVVMGLAIASMHYTGMAAVCFHPAAATPMAHSVSVSNLGVTGISAATFAILALTLIGSLADRSFSRQARLLQSGQERWELAIFANQDGLFDVDLVAGKKFESPRYSEMLGYTPAEFDSSAEAWEALIHPGDRQMVKDNLAAYLERRQAVYDVEYRLRHRQGSWRWIRARGHAVWDGNGRAIRLVGSHSDITDQKEALNELSASQARFSAFMEHIPACAFIKDAEGRLLYTNSMIERTWNLHPGEWVGKSTHEIWPPQLADANRKHEMAVLASNLPSQVVETVQTPGGERRFLSTLFPFSDGTGSRKLGGVSVDITERMQSEEHLRASERRYRELFEQNPLPSWIFGSADLLIVDVNQAAIDHYGWSRQEFVGLSMPSIVIAEEPAHLPEAYSTWRQPKTQRHRRNNQSDIWVEVSTRDIDAGGVPARLMMAEDITERLTAENQIKQAYAQLEVLVEQRTAQLQNSEAKWRGLVEALPQFVWSTRSDGLCDYLSNQWVEFTGIPIEDQLGTGWLNAIHPDDQARAGECWLTASRGSEPFDMEYRIRAKDGSYRWFMSRGRPMRATQHGPVTHWLGTSTDIDDQKRSAEKLERAVAERTVALAEALERAERAAKAKSEFLAVMSHEIRTPMNGVIGMTHLMLDTELTSHQRRYLDAIRSSGQALLTIINDILDFSKVEAGKLELEHAAFDLPALLEESLELVAPTAAEKGLQLSLQLSPHLPACLVGDYGRVRQILLNLVSNAIKFTDAGSVRISVSEETAPEEQSMRAAGSEEEGRFASLRFSVTDSGIGLSAEQQAGLFQPFAQGDVSTTRRFGGTGLGLSIVKRLVELMGGTVGVFSELDRGTTFWFTILLPLAPPQSVSANPVTPATASGLKNTFETCSSRILVADDVVTNQQVAQGILRHLGLRSDVVGNGLEVLDALSRIPYDLILMDVRMPLMDGLEATRQIRKSITDRHLPIIAMTASAMKEDRKDCLDAGMDDFVSKPTSPRSLAEVLAKWLPQSAKGSASGRLLPAADHEPSSRCDNPIYTAPVFELNALVDRFAGDRKLAARILAAFLADMPLQLMALMKAVEEGSIQAVRERAHQIKGASANIGGDALSQAAHEVEMAGRTGDLGMAQARAPGLHRHFALLKEAIETQIKA